MSGSGGGIHAVILRLGDEEFGLDISAVKEIVRFEKVSPFPQARGSIEGVLDLRGHIIAVMDLRKRIGMLERENTDKTRIIIVKARKMIVGLVADGVREVVSFPADLVHSTPALVKSQIDNRYILKMVRWKDRIIFILDLDEIFSREDKEILEKLKKGGSSGESSSSYINRHIRGIDEKS